MPTARPPGPPRRPNAGGAFPRLARRPNAGGGSLRDTERSHADVASLRHTDGNMTTSPSATVRSLWSSLDLPEAALARLALSGDEPVLPSSFAVGTAAQASLALAALSATEIGRLRNGIVQSVAIDMREAALECMRPVQRSTAARRRSGIKLVGPLPPAAGGRDGWVRMHANFAHHRDGALRLLGLPPVPSTPRRAAVAARAAPAGARSGSRTPRHEAGLVVAALRSFDEWDRASAGALPWPRCRWSRIERIGDAPPRRWPALVARRRAAARRACACSTSRASSPARSAGRTLAAYGADVMLVNSPQLPNIEAIADTSRGKLSRTVDLRDAVDRDALRRRAAATRTCFVQGYRPGAWQRSASAPRDVAALRPGIVVRLACRPTAQHGPWAGSAAASIRWCRRPPVQRSPKPQAVGSRRRRRRCRCRSSTTASGFLLAFGVAGRAAAAAVAKAAAGTCRSRSPASPRGCAARPRRGRLCGAARGVRRPGGSAGLGLRPVRGLAASRPPLDHACPLRQSFGAAVDGPPRVELIAWS